MINILSFDAAVHNMGVCCIMYNENWLRDMQKCIAELKLLNKVTCAKYVLLNILHKINRILCTIVTIKHINVYDLLPGHKLNDADVVFKTQKLKSLLCHLDTIMGHPNYVLTEYQMVQNTVSLLLTNQIIYHYTDNFMYEIETKTKKAKLEATKENKNIITKALHDTNMQEKVILTNDQTEKTQIVIVKPALKNTFKLHKDGGYENFICKKSAYNANKSHTTYNFKCFLDAFDIKIDMKNKYDDIADAFIQAMRFAIQLN